MEGHPWFCVLRFVAALFLVSLAAADQPEVKISLGSIRGTKRQTISGNDFYGFQGVPYARPPVGELRFEQPQPLDPWVGIWNATKSPESCLQLPDPLGMNQTLPTFMTAVGSEDCLYLNIYTPKLPSERPSDALLDVLFYIHGGAFQFGTGDWFGPDFLLDRDVVLVTFNYRLSVLGFMSFEDDILPGNYGLKDQTAALKWVSEHIKEFGGDPKKVTIAGLSAGGVSVHFQMLSHLSKGLFHKAISNSGSALNTWAFTKNAKSNANIIATQVGCDPTDKANVLRCLKSRPATQLIAAVQVLQVGQIPVGPVMESQGPDSFIYRDPKEIIELNEGNDVPALFTYTNDEGSLFTRVDASTIDESWEYLAPHILDYNELEPAAALHASQAIRKKFFGDEKIKDNIGSLVKIISERGFETGIQWSAMLLAKHQNSPVYSYRFSFKNSEPFSILKSLVPIPGYDGGAPHGEDNFYVFSTSFANQMANLTESRVMSKTMIDYWMKFVLEDPVESWTTVKSKLPKFTFLDIVSSNPNDNQFKTETSVLEFWDTLGLPDLSSRASFKKNERSEL